MPLDLSQLPMAALIDQRDRVSNDAAPIADPLRRIIMRSAPRPDARLWYPIGSTQSLMSSSICPSCNAPIATANINVHQGVGLCDACDKLSQLSEIVNHATAIALLADPPSGCSIEAHAEIVMVRASMCRWTSVVPTLAFGIFWNGIVSVFVLQVIAGFYNATGKPYPPWFPSMATSGAPANWQDAIMHALFLVPFLIVGIGFIIAVLIQMSGQLEVRIHGPDSWVRTKVALLGWTKRFDADQVRAIGSGSPQPMQGTNFQWIRIEANRTVRFGTVLPGDRKFWLLAALKTLLLPRGADAK